MVKLLWYDGQRTVLVFESDGSRPLRLANDEDRHREPDGGAVVGLETSKRRERRVRAATTDEVQNLRREARRTVMWHPT